MEYLMGENAAQRIFPVSHVWVWLVIDQNLVVGIRRLVSVFRIISGYDCYGNMAHRYSNPKIGAYILKYGVRISRNFMCRLGAFLSIDDIKHIRPYDVLRTGNTLQRQTEDKKENNSMRTHKRNGRTLVVRHRFISATFRHRGSPLQYP